MGVAPVGGVVLGGWFGVALVVYGGGWCFVVGKGR